MKNKSTRHKDDNTFKFQTFSDRISNIDVDIFHKVNHEYEDQSEEGESFFYQTIQKWNVLNLTEGYERFKREIRAHNYVTLPQVLLAKDYIIDILLKYLDEKNPLYLQPILEVVVAVAQDLQKEFYPFYQKFLDVVINLLNTKATEQLEWVFTTLAHLFKILWRPMIKNINAVFLSLVTLLSDTRPEYVSGFAAESFAFVMRKVKDKGAFLTLLLKGVQRNNDAISGCGKLLFEVVKGVNGQFHSCADQFLPFYFESLRNTESPDVLFEVLEHVVAGIAADIHPQKNQLIWDVLLQNLDKDCNGVSYELNLRLLGQMVEYKQGKLVSDTSAVIRQLVRILSLNLPIISVSTVVIQISISLLLARNIRLPQEQASQLVRKLLSMDRQESLLYFVDNVHSCSFFELLILPSFLKKCADYRYDKQCLYSLTKIVMDKAPLKGSGIDMASWTKYPLKTREFDIFDRLIECVQSSGNEEKFCGLVCLPHLEMNVEQTTTAIATLCRTLEVSSSQFWTNIILETLIHLKHSLLKEFPLLFEKFLPLANDIMVLKGLSLLFTHLHNTEVITMDNLLKLNEVCHSNFSSPHHTVRLLTSQVYSLFEQLQEFDLKYTDKDIVPEKFKVFSLIFEVEQIEPLVHTYRDQLQRLEKLNYDKPQMVMCLKTPFKLIPLRYLCGVLYMNFKLLWEPVGIIMETHAHGLEQNEFWGVFVGVLNKAVHNVNTPQDVEVEVMDSDFEVLTGWHQGVQTDESKPDFVNYRALLWKSMALFADVAEAKTRDVVQLFLDFIDGEYRSTNSDPVMCDVRIYEEGHVDKVQPERQRKATMKTLLLKLSVFAKFKSPKSMYREPELYKLYFDFLKHKNPEIQKKALDCIGTYKFKYVTPYKDHLYNLVDDANFKNAITGFQIDKDNSAILEEHRDNLIPIVLQIVFSKMTGKTGLRTGGKSQNRRNLVLRFLAGCREQEMLAFVQKAFVVYERFTDTVEVSLEACLAPKKILSSINLLNVILDQFGGLMGNQLISYLLRVMFTIGRLVLGVYTQQDKVHQGYHAIFRNLRTAAIKTLERFFEHFPYPWNAKEIDTVFELFVWPYLQKLNIEGIHSPTSLLKLIRQWGVQPRYFKLLVKTNNGSYILPHLFQLLVNPKTNITVINVIYEIVESLLKFETSEEDVEVSVNGVTDIDQSIMDKCPSKLNYGSCILLPHVPVILDKIKLKLEGKNRSLNKTELFILCRISELVWEADVSDTILHLLMPIALKKASSDEEVVSQLMTIVLNLMKNVDTPQKHLRSLTPLFGEVNYPSCRKLLMVVFSLMKLGDAAALVNDLNAYDSKWVDQPDFEKRHSAFKQIDLLIKQQQLDVSVGCLLVHNMVFTLKSEKDLSLKDMSSHTLKTLCPALVKLAQRDNKELDYVLNTCIYTLIKQGMRLNNHDYRNECLSLLGCLARECADAHFTLRDLNVFTNSHDMEVDFFENLTHMQTHRHVRAMNKICQLIKEATVSPNPKTISQFLLPIATHYLCSDKYLGKNSLIDGAIEMVGVLCRIIPWHQYEGVLKFTLQKLRFKVEFQKQLVRLVVVILDAFHYDLSKGHVELKKVDEVDVGVEQDIEEVLEGVIEEEEDDKIIDKVTILCKSTATRVINTIQQQLLPQLQKSLAQLTSYDSSHKVNRKKTGFEREEEDMARVPISLAVVKLLQRLPQEILDSNLPSVFLKLCSFLKSQLESVRRIARETLQNIVLALGPKYLKMLLGEIAPLMNRGFQVHVLVFTIHGVLSCLKGMYEPRDVDEVLLTVLNLCTADLFGIQSEEKEVVKITVKVTEAKSTKSYDTLKILAQNITEKCLLDMLLPIKHILETSHSFKTVTKAQEALRHISTGLVENDFISVDNLLKFAYGTSSEQIPDLLPAKKKKKDKETRKVEKEDCFIIQKIPGNRRAYRELNVKTGSNTNSHVLVEFGLRLLLVLLKRDKVKDEEYRKFIDPFVVIFIRCLKSKHVKLCSLTLQCLQWVMKYEVPTIKANIKSITKNMFLILHKYAAAGLSKGDNFDLVVAVFKTMAVLVRDVQYHTVDQTQLKTLLLYVEQDMHDYDRQATAFGLLKAIISRKLVVPEINDVMAKVAELSVISELNHVRSQARSVFHQFIMEYPLGHGLEKHLSFYISQLSFEMQHGRESAIEMIQALINSFPIAVLKSHSGTLLITLGARLVNDEVPECRKMVADCVTSMLGRLAKTDRDPLFEILTVWLKDKEVSHRRLAAQLCGLFVTVEKAEFESRLPTITPLILKQFGLTNKTPGNLLKVTKDKNTPEDIQRVKDHHYFQTLQLILKICAICPDFLKSKAIEDLAYFAQNLLAYPHDWVRLAAAQFLGFVLSSMDVDKLAAMLLEGQTGRGYLMADPDACVKSLTLDLCDQLQPGVKTDLAEQVIKNLVFIAKVLQQIPIKSDKVNLLWLCKRMRKIVNNEIIDNNHNTTLRNEVFKFIAGITLALDFDNLRPIIHHLVAPLVREMITTEESNAPIRQLAKEVANHIKRKLGIEEYTTTLQRLQQNLNIKRAERKREKRQLAVTDPEGFAKKKIRVHEKKKVMKKRKLEEVRGKKGFKRKKLVDVELDSSEVM